MWLAIGAALGLTAVFQVIGAPLTTGAAPAGILSFEFAGTLANAQAMIASWGPQAQLNAALSLGLDFLYPPVYAAAISLSLLAAAPHLPKRWRKLAGWLAGLVWLAAALDYVENLALIQLLFGSTWAVWPPLAWTCAALKFAILLPGIFLALVGGVRAALRQQTIPT